MPQFERFTRSMVPSRSQPWVTIQKRGNLSLNRSAFVALGSPESVELLYDRDAQVIGMRKTFATDADGVHVRSTPRSTNGPWLVSALAFTKFYGIDTSETRRWPAHLDGDILCIDLTGESTIRGA